MKQKKIITAISIALILASLICLFYPIMSITVTKFEIESKIERFINRAENVVDLGDTTFEEAVEEGIMDEKGYLVRNEITRQKLNLDVDVDADDPIWNEPVVIKADIDRLKKDSEEYNDSLKKSQRDLFTDSSDYKGSALDLSQYGIFDGIYGYVSIPSISLKLPIYLGSNDFNMSMGAAHLCYTSLPTGGNSTNCVLSGHTGYTGKEFFDYLPQVKQGDVVTVTNYWDTLEYKVIRTFTRRNDEVEDLFIEEGKDLLSMLTCFYENGIKKRFFVICEKIS